MIYICKHLKETANNYFFGKVFGGENIFCFFYYVHMYKLNKGVKGKHLYVFILKSDQCFKKNGDGSINLAFPNQKKNLMLDAPPTN
jgi:hypothetical protein